MIPLKNIKLLSLMAVLSPVELPGKIMPSTCQLPLVHTDGLGQVYPIHTLKLLS